MSALLACVACLSAAIACFADKTATVPATELNPEWMAARGAGVKSYNSRAYPEALASFQQCWTLANTPLMLGLTADDIAGTLHMMGREAEARQWYERALDAWRSQPDSADHIVHTLTGLADVDRGLGDFAEAENALRSGIAASRSREQQAQMKNRLGDMLREQGRDEEARQELVDALALSAGTPKEQIDAFLGFGQLDRETMRWADAIAYTNKALTLARQQHDSEAEALALRNLGLTHLNKGELALAEPLLKRSLEILENNPIEPPQQIANALQCLSGVYFEMHKYAPAEEALLRGLDYLKQSIGLEHPHSAVMMEQVAEIFAVHRRYSEAQEYADHAYAIMVRIFGANSFSAAVALTTVGKIKQDRHDLAGAAADYESALQTLRSSEADDSQSVLIVMSRYASVLRALHRRQEAKTVDAQIHALRLR